VAICYIIQDWIRKLLHAQTPDIGSKYIGGTSFGPKIRAAGNDDKLKETTTFLLMRLTETFKHHFN